MCGHVPVGIVRQRVTVRERRGLEDGRFRDDVKREMAVEQPVSGTIGLPCHRQRTVREHRLRNGEAAAGWRECRIADARALRIDAKIDPVQVHRVHPIARVHDAIADAVA